MAKAVVLDFGGIVRGTVETASNNIVPISIYVAALTALASASELFPLEWLSGAVGDGDTLAIMQSYFSLGIGAAGVVIFLTATIGQFFCGKR